MYTGELKGEKKIDSHWMPESTDGTGYKEIIMVEANILIKTRTK